jgi:uncharacterized membrane protein YphA (DoxX/SURF4 family)
MPGFGLLVLRATAGVALVSCGAIHFIAWEEGRVLTLIAAGLSSICGLLLLLGLFNYLASSLGALISVGSALALIHLPVSNVSAIPTAAIAIALLCLGPGAYSVDARRHGRREIIIPARSRSSNDSSV